MSDQVFFNGEPVEVILTDKKGKAIISKGTNARFVVKKEDLVYSSKKSSSKKIKEEIEEELSDN